MCILVVVKGILSVCNQYIIATALDLYFIYPLQFKLLTVDQIQSLSSLCSFLLSGQVHITLNNL